MQFFMVCLENGILLLLSVVAIM